MKKKKTFHDVIQELNETHNYVEDFELDYISGKYDKEPMPYDEFYSITRFGAAEGIYTDFYVIRESGKKEHIATAKTLLDSNACFIMMHTCAAYVIIELNKIISKI